MIAPFSWWNKEANCANDRVQVLDQNGKLLSNWRTKLIGSAAIYLDADDIVLIVGHKADLANVLTPEGKRPV